MPRSSTLRWRLAQLLEQHWWRHYLRRRQPQEYLEAKRAYWQRVFEELNLYIEPGARVLDAGCGPAGVFLILHDRQRVTALDPLLSEYGNLDIFSRDDYPTVDFVAQPIERYGGNKPFDAIYCFNAINHVSDWDGSLDRLTSLSRPGTRMTISSDVHRHSVLYQVFRALPGDVLHPQQHRAEDYRAALESRGWHIDREDVLRTERIFEYRAWVCTLV